MIWETEPNTGTVHLEVPYLFNVVQDPKEETDVNATQGWVRGPMRKMAQAFAKEPRPASSVPPGAPDDSDPNLRFRNTTTRFCLCPSALVPFLPDLTGKRTTMTSLLRAARHFHCGSLPFRLRGLRTRPGGRSVRHLLAGGRWQP